MKGYKINKPLELIETEVNVDNNLQSSSKVRIVKALITTADVLRFNGTIPTNKIIGSAGIGIVNEADANLLDIEKNKRVFMQSKRGCGECFRCIDGNKSRCLAPLTAGEDFDGFLADFMNAPNDSSFILPESIDDNKALFIDKINLALNIIDTLKVNKGDYVTIVGANNLGVILAELLIYYQAVPILLTDNEEEAEIARKSDVYYVLSDKEDWNKEISVITSNRMTDKVVFISDCNIPIFKAFSLASKNASIVYTGDYSKSNAISFSTAVKKQLNIICLNSGFGYTESSINLITNNAINFNHLKVNVIKYKDVPETLKKLNEDWNNDLSVTDTIVELI